jgi:hypothetical protein
MQWQRIQRARACSPGECFFFKSPTTSNWFGNGLSSHLPLMFIGMEHIVLSNYAQADESLKAANAMCDGDPLLINECGVLAFNHGWCFPLTISLDWV